MGFKAGIVAVYAAMAIGALFFASGCVAFAQGNVVAAVHFDGQAVFMGLLSVWLNYCS